MCLFLDRVLIDSVYISIANVIRGNYLSPSFPQINTSFPRPNPHSISNASIFLKKQDFNIIVDFLKKLYQFPNFKKHIFKIEVKYMSLI